jgi:hypothetical protein
LLLLTALDNLHNLFCIHSVCEKLKGCGSSLQLWAWEREASKYREELQEK